MAEDGPLSRLPVTTVGRREFEAEAREGETLRIEAGRVGDVVKAAWGAGSNNTDVTPVVRRHILADGSLVVAASASALEVTDDPSPGQPKRLVVRYTEQFYVAQDDRLAGVDTTTTEGRLVQAQVFNERLVEENRRLQESLVKAEKRETHYRDVEDRLREEVRKRTRLEQAVFENEGALVSTRVAELEKDQQRLRRLLKGEQQAVATEQQQRRRLQEELTALREAHSVPGASVAQQIAEVRAENERLARNLTEVTRLNAQLQLTTRTAAEADELRARDFAASNPGQQLHHPHVTVRRTFLCPKCRAAVDTWEKQAASRGLARRVVAEGGGGVGVGGVPPPPDAAWRQFHSPSDASVPLYHHIPSGRTQWEPPHPQPQSALTRI